MPQTDDLLERIRRIRQMAAQEAALSVEREGPPLDRFPQSVPPSRPPRAEDNVPGPLRLAEQPYVKAELLEEEARPTPEPGGWRGIGEAALRGLAGSSHPGGYHGYRADLDARERQRQQDLLARAQRLRAEGLQRDQMNIEGQRYQQSFDLNRREFESADAERKARVEALNRPQFKEFGTAQGGIQYGSVDPQTAQFKQQGEIPGASPSNAMENDTVTTEDKGVLQWNPQTKRYDIPVGSRPRSQSVFPEPVTQVHTTDKDGKDVIQLVTREGRVIETFPAPRTADMRNKEIARSLVKRSVDAVRGLSDRIITNKNRYQQLVESLKRGGEAAVMNDPEYRTYQDSRMALAGNLAVAQQGGRPSDADIKAIWAPLVPDIFRDTQDSASMKWDMINVMGAFDQPVGPASPTTTTSPTSNTGQTVPMVTPDGKVWNVPADKVKEAEARGAKRQ